jgi:exopolysaccharide biosynthesis polyprenyl glycosylphosphotransferase
VTATMPESEDGGPVTATIPSSEGGGPVTATMPDSEGRETIGGAELIAGGGSALRQRHARLGSRVVAVAGRGVLTWLALAVIAAADHPLDAGGLAAVSVAAALVLVNVRAAFAGVPYALGPWMPTLIGTTTGIVFVAALNPHLAGLNLSIPALLAAGIGIFVSLGIWECVLERTLGRRRVLVVGSSDLAAVATAAERGRRMAFEVLGTEPVLDGLTEIVTVQRPDLIVLTDEQSCSEALDRLLDIADGRFRVAGLTSFYEYALGCVPLQHITPMWFMSLLHVRQRPYAQWVKRAFDLVVAVIALMVTAPLLPVIALAVSRTPGPVIYRQTRVGAGGRRFQILKFRTMVDGAERPGEAVWAQAADPRTTPIGAFLRRTHLDELPQLVNVLRGEMSIVGPRPERPEFIAMLESSIPFWSRRLLIKPGLTGWAQVHCGYASDEQAANEKLAYDFWYLRHRNLAVDLAVCASTLRIVLEILEPWRVALRRLRATR